MQLPAPNILLIGGIVLLILGLIGGGGIQTNYGSLPKFSRPLRLFSGVVGVVLTTTGLWAYLITTPILSLTPTPPAGPTLAPSASPLNPDCRIKINGIITGKDLIQINQSISVIASVDNPENHPLLYNWQATNGQMNPGLRTSSVQSTYTAPANLVDDTISLTVTAPGCALVSLSKQIQIIE